MKEKDRPKHFKADVLQRADGTYGTSEKLSKMLFYLCTEFI